MPFMATDRDPPAGSLQGTHEYKHRRSTLMDRVPIGAGGAGGRLRHLADGAQGTRWQGVDDARKRGNSDGLVRSSHRNSGWFSEANSTAKRSGG